MADAAEQLSTSALAKRLKLPIQQLFVTLRDYGWIDRQGESWVLTGKGELHGGRYRDSQRYGRYIVWPEELTDHPLITAIESNQRIYPGGMRRYYPHLTAGQINRTLREIGLQRHTPNGLEVTDLGQRFGGRQEYDEEHALAVISWPHELVDNPVIHRELNRLAGSGRVAAPTADAENPAGDDATADLFAAPSGDDDSETAHSPHATERCGLDGHRLASLLQLRVCDWLYEAQLAHAHLRRLPVEEELVADFYVPAAGLYIECWEAEIATPELTRRLRTREVCRELGLAYLEVAAADMGRIDTVLASRLSE
jgi:hypothetical protein